MVQVLPLASPVQLHQMLVGHVRQLAQGRATAGELVEGLQLFLHFNLLGDCSEKEVLTVSAKIFFILFFS